ncbi:MAG: hypothetical protein EOM31_01060 [Bacteroidia bacterium]|nr:hypothetical protein [Bacteroidia bacterium]
MMKLKNCFRLVLLLPLFALTSAAQINRPCVQNFTKGTYPGGSQNWGVVQGADGVIYVANNSGLLEYDGKRWRLHTLPSKGRIRSLFADRDGRLYSGSFEEFGYWDKNEYGHLTYHSLSEKLHQFNFHNDEIWSIVKLGTQIYFQSFSSYFTYDGVRVHGVTLPFNPLSFHAVDRHLFIGASHKGLYLFDGKTFEAKFSKEAFAQSDVIASVGLGRGKTVVATVSSGLFLYADGHLSPYLKAYEGELRSAVINRMTLTCDSLLIVGTIHQGVYAFNNRQQLVWKVNTASGLQNNTILGLCGDASGNVWAALDNGVALIYANHKLRFSSDKFEGVGSVYAEAYLPPFLYIGTNQGLYVYDVVQDSRATMVPGTSGQIWDLSVVDEQLLCGHNDYTFRVEGEKALKLVDIAGGACLKKFEHDGVQYLIQGTYTKLTLYKKNSQGLWTFYRTVEEFMNPIKYLEIDQNLTVWASHIEKGLYRLKLSQDLSKVVSEKVYYTLGEPDGKYKINVFKLQGRVVFADGKQLYTYDDLSDSIVAFDKLNEKLQEFKSLHKIIPVGGNRYWLMKDESCALVAYNGDELTFIHTLPYALLNNKVLGQDETVIPMGAKGYLFGLENALALYTPDGSSKGRLGSRPSFFISQVQVQELSSKRTFLLPLQKDEATEAVHWAYNKNSQIAFHLAFPDFTDKESYFKYRLLGLDDKWSDATQQPVIEFSRLPYGTYRFEVKAFSSDGVEKAFTAYEFCIDPPFYATWWALGGYVSLLLWFTFLLKRYTDRKIERNKLKVEAEQEAKLRERREKLERSIIQLKNEKLEAEVLHKSKELASSTMSIINKNKVFQTLKDELTEQKKSLGTQYPNKHYNKLMAIIDEQMSSDDDWLVFQANFDRIHENFFRHLKSTYPDLTPNDLKLCAYLRLNLSTKDMAHLMNISVRGVEVARYRLRKKMNIPSEKNLVDFMIEFK